MSNDIFQFLKDLNDKQKEVCLSNENILLKACPGSGKTRTLTYKLAYICMNNSLSHKLNIAITYTNRAADEIKNRIHELGIDSRCIWAGTIHQFCLEYIIRPYSMYDSDLSKGYHIIDEYVQMKYLKTIASENGMTEIVKYKNPLDFSDIREQYYIQLKENKEIDFDMILEKSLYLLENRHFIKVDISIIIRSIFVDEYQDTNELQYKIIREIYLKNKKIQLLFVGDTDQAIYGGIGGVAKTILELNKMYQTEFKQEVLNGCYRSSQKIVDYYSEFQIVNNLIESQSTIRDEQCSITYNNDIPYNELIPCIAKTIKSELEKGVPESEICVVAPQWWLLFPFSNAIKEILPEVMFDAPDITPFKRDPLNVYYVISKIVFTRSGRNSWLRKRYANELLKILEEEYGYYFNNKYTCIEILDILNTKRSKCGEGLESLKNCIEYFFSRVNIINDSKLIKAYKDYIEKTEDRINKYNLQNDVDFFYRCFAEKDGVVVNTFHGVKGEEYTTVIAYGLLLGYIPHWNLFYDRSVSEEYKINEAKKLIYVVASRAKQNIILFSEKGRKTRKGDALVSNQQLANYSFEYDKFE